MNQIELKTILEKINPLDQDSAVLTAFLSDHRKDICKHFYCERCWRVCSRIHSHDPHQYRHLPIRSEHYELVHSSGADRGVQLYLSHSCHGEESGYRSVAIPH